MISVIIPVYNAESYLGSCLDSILEQTFIDIEVILIDDGSVDSSGSICDEYAAKDNRIKVYHFENRGVTCARLHGISVSKGDWITFVDADDTLPSNALQLLLTVAQNENVDVVSGAARRISPNYNRLIPLALRGKISASEYSKALLQGKVLGGILGKMFRKSKIREDMFNIPPSIKNNEDLIMNLRIARNIENAFILPYDVVYNYYSREGSASKRRMSIEEWDEIFDQVALSISENEKLEYYLYVAGTMYLRMVGNGLDYRKSKYYPVLLREEKTTPCKKMNLYISYLAHPNRYDRFYLWMGVKKRQIKKIMLYFFFLIKKK